MLSDSGIN